MKGEAAWAITLSSIAAYDFLCEPGQTLSESFRKQPKALQIGELALLGFHLLAIEPRIDPLNIGFKKLKGYHQE